MAAILLKAVMVDFIKKFDQSIGKCIALASFVFAWTHFSITDDAIFFFHILAPCCFLLFGSLALPVKYRDFDYRVNIVGFFFTFSNLIDEFFGDPQKLQFNEYVFAIITIIFVIRGRKRKNKLAKRIEYI